MNKYRWGITGTGMIAKKMADALGLLENAEIKAVLSRTKESGNAFAKKYNIPEVYTDIESFACSGNIDIVYVATPHSFHLRDTLASLKGGKHVMCEKPMGVNEKEETEMIETAKKEKRLLMEAFWTYYFPNMQKTLSLIKEGAIGKPVMVDARFCFSHKYDPLHRNYNPDLAGGAMLDIGLYCISFAQKVFGGYPVDIKGSAVFAPTGTDISSSYLLTYSDNRLATLTSSFAANTHKNGYIFGEKGFIKMPFFWYPEDVILNVDGKEKIFKFERFGNGYTYEAVEMMKMLDNNQLESTVFSFDDSIKLIRIMDTLRQQWGMKYPFEV